jgi:predicted dehydrogenase
VSSAPRSTHVHLKDTKPEPERLAIAGVLDQKTGTDFHERAWNFRTLGVGHDRDYWAAFVAALRSVGYDDVLSIENEDPYQEGEAGVREAAAFMQPLLSSAGAALMAASTARGVGVIGCGNIAMGHIDGWAGRPAGFAIVAVADPTSERREVGRERAGLPAEDAYGDYREVLARADVGVVDVCVPPHVRAEIVVAAAQAGKHILSEKPLATVPADGAAMVDAARGAGVTLGLVHNYLFQPEVVLARELIASGVVGDVEMAVINYLGVHDYPGNAAYRPTWRHDPAQSGGGILIDIIHLAYLAEALLGRRIERVSAYANAREVGAAVEDIVSCRFETAESAAVVNVGWAFGPDGIDGPGGMEVSGTQGRLTISYENGGTFAPFHELRLTDRDGTRAVSPTTTAPHGTVALAVEEFAAALAAGSSPAAPGEDGLRSLEAIMAAYESAAVGRTVGLPLATTDPVFRRGVVGLQELGLPEWSPVRRKRIFGVADAG